MNHHSIRLLRGDCSLRCGLRQLGIANQRMTVFRPHELKKLVSQVEATHVRLSASISVALNFHSIHRRRCYAPWHVSLFKLN